MGIHHGHILRVLRDEGPQSRAALSRRAKLSATTLTHVTAQLLREGYIRENETNGAARVGRPAQAVRLVADAARVAGVHIGAGHVQVAITDLKAEPKAMASFEFDIDSADPDRVVERVAASVAGLAAEIQVDAASLLGVGVGVPGPVDTDRRRALASINVGWRELPMADKLEQLGAQVSEIEAGFQPEHGAYGGGHHHSHHGEEGFNYAPKLHHFGVRT